MPACRLDGGEISDPGPARRRAGAENPRLASVTGVEGHLTHACATAGDGPLGLRITGLPGTEVGETRDRIYAAVANSGEARTALASRPWPRAPPR